MGTPPSSDLRARSNRAFDLGRSSMNFFCSDCIRNCRRSRSIEGIHLPKLSRSLHSKKVPIVAEPSLPAQIGGKAECRGRKLSPVDPRLLVESPASPDARYSTESTHHPVTVLVPRYRLANFFPLFRAAVAICRSDCRSDRAQRNESTFIRSRRLFFQDNFPIKLRHACVVGRVVLDLVVLGLLVAGPQLFFACPLRDAQLVEIVLHFVGDDLFPQVERVLFVFHVDFLAAREDLVTSMLFVPLGERRGHVH